MSAYDLFKACGVSKAAYEQFLRPTLLVGLFSTPGSAPGLPLGLVGIWCNNN